MVPRLESNTSKCDTLHTTFRCLASDMLSQDSTKWIKKKKIPDLLSTRDTVTSLCVMVVHNKTKNACIKYT